MKIPETSANVGAYYGNEENGQWQPNGVIIDNGVGGGVVGSGDAGMHRAPVYPVHIPRGHVPTGYVMTAPYYGAPYAAVPPPQPDDFSDYMWMENEEEFDKQVLQQLEEEALMEQCIEAMLEDEQRERRANRQNRHDYPTTSNGAPPVSLEEAVSRSTLNPLAAEFVPTRVPHRHASEVKPESTPPAQPEAPSPPEDNSRTEAEDKNTEERIESKAEVSEETKTEEVATPPKDPPEVSAADVHPTAKLPKKEAKKQPETKKPAKTEVKKKPVVVKSEPKIQPKKKEVKIVKSEVKVVEKSEEVPVPVVETIKPQTPTEEVQSAPGLKPINYAAAAKASKPKPKSTTPPIEKPAAPAVKTEKPKPEPSKEKPKPDRTEKKATPKEKTALKEKVNVQRKNSAK